MEGMVTYTQAAVERAMKVQERNPVAPWFRGPDPSPKTGPDTPRPYLASPIGAAYQQ
jgi:hypothetical protein